MEGKEQRNQFQDFLLQSTGRELPVFGHDLFRNSKEGMMLMDMAEMMADRFKHSIDEPNDEPNK